MKNLFGEEIAELPPEPLKRPSKYQQWKAFKNYRKSTGPDKCGNCAHHVINECSKVYHKCKLLGLSSSSATDIRVGHVCMKWEIIK